MASQLSRYSPVFADAVRQAPRTMLGVQLGKECIRLNVSVIKVAEKFNVSRQTVYNWFLGYTNPAKSMRVRVEAFLQKLKSKKE